MLNIGRMAPGSQDYYLDHVARGVEDYYLGRGEAPGRWLGRQADGFGLAGEVDAERLGHVLSGSHPVSGQRLTRRSAKRPGFDLAFRAPKSVSLLWALADSDIAGQVHEAHDRAVASALRYLEDDAGRTRRGAGGTESVAIDGFTGAGFTHRTSRDGDPLLHTHVLVANIARTTDDGQWRTLDGRRLFTHARTAGFVYQSVLRDELTARLGVAWQPVVSGHADIDGVDRAWIDQFSKRRAAILAALDERGESSARAAQVATLDTRRRKEHQADELDLRGRWRAEARTAGMPEGWWRQLLDRRSPARPDLPSLHDRLVAGEGLTASTSTFARRDLVRAVAEALPEGGSLHEIVSSVDTLLRAGRESGQLLELGPARGALAEVIHREDGTPIPAGDHEPRFTTRGLLATEQRALGRACARAGEGAGVAATRAVDAALAARPTMTAEQTAMIRRLTTSGAGVEVVVGKAGTGKTFALDAARDAWERSGRRVSGTALAARAALELEESSGIRSTTLTGLLRDTADPDRSALAPGQVLVVDEAGMVGTRRLAQLLDVAAERQVKVVLVGDPGQLPEIEAGGLFRACVNQLPAVELTSNRRQRAAWEVEALDRLRRGAVEDVVDTYAAHGRLVTAETADEVRERLVADWWEALDLHAADRAVMVALRRSDVTDLNRRARALLTAEGGLVGPSIEVDGTSLRAGDRVVCLRNDRRVGVVNGTRGTVTAVGDDHRVELRTDDGRLVDLPAAYVDAGWLDHGYAITGHKAQGVTVDHTFVLGSDALYREWGYVAMSRGRESNHLYVHAHAELVDGGPHLDRRRDPLAESSSRLSRSRAETSLTSTTVVPLAPPDRAVPDRASEPTIGEQLEEAKGFLLSPPVRERRRIEGVRVQLESRLAWCETALATAVAELESSGIAVTPGARRAKRSRRERMASLAGEIAELETRLADLSETLSRLPSADVVERATAVERSLTDELRVRADGAVAAARRGTPGYLLRSIGNRSTEPAHQRAWDDAVRAVERYRLAWDGRDPDRPFGAVPHRLSQQHDHERALRAIAEAVAARERVVSRAPSRARAR